MFAVFRQFTHMMFFAGTSQNDRHTGKNDGALAKRKSHRASHPNGESSIGATKSSERLQPAILFV
jgi:hypothetical protein